MAGAAHRDRAFVTTHSEHARQWVHIGSGLFALLLRLLTWWQAAALAAIALLFNLLLLPRIGGRRLYRPVDDARGFPLGILLYPLSVLLLTLAFPRASTSSRPRGASWRSVTARRRWSAGVTRNARSQSTQRHSFSAGSASSAFIRRRLPWNREKTVAGTRRVRRVRRRWRVSRSRGGCGLPCRRCRRSPSTIVAPIVAALAGGAG